MSDGAVCGHVDVPLDRGDALAGSISIHFELYLHTDPGPAKSAIIVNFGAALANSGGNFALASFDPSQLTPEEAEIVQAVLLALSPLFASDPPGSSAAGGTIAKVTTGNAKAVGNASTTDISQTAVGHVTGDNSASSTQRAAVGNLGLALANTGFNGALGGALDQPFEL